MSELVAKLAEKYGDPRGACYGKRLTENLSISYDSVAIALNANTVVVGGAGSGKSYCFVEPNIACAEGYSFVDVDLDGVHYKRYHEVLAARGYQVKLFDSTAPFNTESIDFETIGEKPTAVFVKVATVDTSMYPLVSMFYEHLFNVLFRVADLKYEGRLPVHVELFFDEFANLSILRGKFQTYLPVMRARNISATIILQSLSQLKALDPDVWEMELGCCDSLLFMGSHDPFTQEYISKLCGTSDKGREIVSARELAFMPNNKALVLLRGEGPVFDSKSTHAKVEVKK